MSSPTNSAAETSTARATPPYHFHVDDRHLTSDEPVLTGAQIKARAAVDPSFGLFLEGHGNDADRQIGDADTGTEAILGRAFDIHRESGTRRGGATFWG